MGKLVAFDRVIITLIDSESETYETKFVYGQDVPNRQVGDIRPLEGTPTGEVLATGKTLIHNEMTVEFPYGNTATLIELGLRCTIRIPLITGGRIIGALGLQSVEVGSYGPREQALLERLAAACSAAARPIDDKRGTVEFRTKVSGVLARRAATIALARAKG